MGIEKAMDNLKQHHFEVSRFQTAAEAANYIDAALNGKTVGMGGSVTLGQLGLYEKLQSHNTVYWHLQQGKTDEIMLAASCAQVYITSVNAVAETGELVNIDGRGNRLAGTLMKKEKVYLIAGQNKFAPDLAQALDRARNVAAPRNCRRLETKTPCSIAGRCCDCSSPDRICNALLVLWRKPYWCDSMEVVIVDEELGY